MDDQYAWDAGLPPGGPDLEYGARHTGGDQGVHHWRYRVAAEDAPRCGHCMRLLTAEGLCYRCDDDGLADPPWAPTDDELAHPRNAQEALLNVQYREFRALFEDPG